RLRVNVQDHALEAVTVMIVDFDHALLPTLFVRGSRQIQLSICEASRPTGTFDLGISGPARNYPRRPGTPSGRAHATSVPPGRGHRTPPRSGSARGSPGRRSPA